MAFVNLTDIGFRKWPEERPLRYNPGTPIQQHPVPLPVVQFLDCFPLEVHCFLSLVLRGREVGASIRAGLEALVFMRTGIEMKKSRIRHCLQSLQSDSCFSRRPRIPEGGLEHGYQCSVVCGNQPEMHLLDCHPKCMAQSLGPLAYGENDSGRLPPRDH